MSSSSDPGGAAVRRWLVALNVGVVALSLGLGIVVEPRYFFLLALVPLGLVPFSYARMRLDRAVGAELARSASPRAAVWVARVVRTLGIALDAVLVAQLVTSRRIDALPLLHGAALAWLGPVWFSAHGLLCLAYAMLGCVRWLRRAMLRLRARVLWVSQRDEPAERQAVEAPERRLFLQRVGLVGAGLPFFASVSSVSLSYDFRVEEREIELPGWPRELDGLRVAHLSDIHVGGGMTRERLLRVAELTNGCRPDVVAHTGDFLTHGSGDFDAPLYEALARIRAPYGQWACLGNHDFDDAHRLVRRLAEAGVVVLRDTVARLAVQGTTLEVAGLDFVFDPSNAAAGYARLIDGWDALAAGPRLLLNHDPWRFAELPSGAADLVLSGHTHGGHLGIQISRSLALTIVGMVGLPDQGLFSRGDMRLFVTRCVGFYGYPMRIGIPPEIAVLVLRAPRPISGAVAATPIPRPVVLSRSNSSVG